MSTEYKVTVKVRADEKEEILELLRVLEVDSSRIHVEPSSHAATGGAATTSAVRAVSPRTAAAVRAASPSTHVAPVRTAAAVRAVSPRRAVSPSRPAVMVREVTGARSAHTLPIRAWSPKRGFVKVDDISAIPSRPARQVIQGRLPGLSGPLTHTTRIHPGEVLPKSS